LEIIKKIIAFVPLCLGIFVGIYWMLAGSIITGIISFYLNSFYTGKKLNYSSWMQIKDVAPLYGLAFLIALAVFFFKYLPLSYWFILPLQIVVGIVVFIAVCETKKIEEYVELKDLAAKSLSKLNNIV
jgi:hypothetical protein